MVEGDTSGGTGGKKVPLEQRITPVQLRELHARLMEYPDGVPASLFFEIAQYILSERQEEIKRWYLRITSGLPTRHVVTWEDVSAHLMQEGEQRSVEDEKKSEFMEQRLIGRKAVQHAHMDMMTSLLVHPTNGMYYSGAIDGIVKQWNAETMEFQRIVHNHGRMITALSLMRTDTKLVIAGLDRRVVITDLLTHQPVRVFCGGSFSKDESEVQTLKSTQDIRRYGMLQSEMGRRKATTIADIDMKKEAFTERCRDSITTQKNQRMPVTVLKGMTEPPISMITPVEISEDAACFGLQDGRVIAYPLDPEVTRMGFKATPTVSPLFEFHTHIDQVTQLIWNKRASSIFSSSWDSTIKLTDVSTAAITQTFRQQKSVLGFVWSDRMQFLVSYSPDRCINVWSMHRQSPAYVLEGHGQPIVSMCFNDQADQLITMSRDQVIKVWDVRTFRVMQTITNTKLSFHESLRGGVSTIRYDNSRDQIVAASTYPFAYVLSKNVHSFSQGYQGHREPPVTCLFNSLSNLLVTADLYNIYLWDVFTGAKALDFNVARSLKGVTSARVSSKRESGSKFSQLSCACWTTDRSGLVTGSLDGLVVLWDYIKGQPQMLYEHATETEISDVLYISKLDVRLVTFACSNSVHVLTHLENSLRLDSEYTFDSPIKSICMCGSAVMCCGTDDAQVYLYNIDMLKVTGVLGTKHEGVSVVSLIYLDSRGDFLLVAMSNGDCRIFEFHKRQHLGTFNPLASVDHSLYSVHLDPTQTIMLVGDSQGVVSVVDISAIRNGMGSSPDVQVSAMHTVSTDCVSSLRYIEVMNAFVVGSLDYAVTIFKMDGGSIIGRFGTERWDARNQLTYRGGFMQPVRTKQTSRDGRRFLTSLVDDTPMGRPVPRLTLGEDTYPASLNALTDSNSATDSFFMTQSELVQNLPTRENVNVLSRTVVSLEAGLAPRPPASQIPHPPSGSQTARVMGSKKMTDDGAMTQLTLRTLVERVSEKVRSFRRPERTRQKEWTSRISSLMTMRDPVDVEEVFPTISRSSQPHSYR